MPVRYVYDKDHVWNAIKSLQNEVAKLKGEKLIHKKKCPLCSQGLIRDYDGWETCYHCNGVWQEPEENNEPTLDL